MPCWTPRRKSSQSWHDASPSKTWGEHKQKIPITYAVSRAHRSNSVKSTDTANNERITSCPQHLCPMYFRHLLIQLNSADRQNHEDSWNPRLTSITENRMPVVLSNDRIQSNDRILSIVHCRAMTEFRIINSAIQTYFYEFSKINYNYWTLFRIRDTRDDSTIYNNSTIQTYFLTIFQQLSTIIEHYFELWIHAMILQFKIIQQFTNIFDDFSKLISLIENYFEFGIHAMIL